MNLRAPLLESILAQARDLPPPPTFDDSLLDEKDGKSQSAQPSKDQGRKTLPKWLKIGQSKIKLINPESQL